jgi:ribose transport system permease protein
MSGMSAIASLVLAFVFCAMLASVIRLPITSQMGSGQANLGGNRLMLPSIAAAVIGDTPLRGGTGRPEMVGLSALFPSALTNALNSLRLDSKKELVVLGLVVVAAVASDPVGRSKAAAE